MSQLYVISVMFKDRVGIVSDVATAIHHLNGNLEDVSQTVLRGYFTMIVMADFPENVDEAAIRNAFSETKGLTGAQIGVLKADPETPASFPVINTEESEREQENSNLYVLTASGPDQPGLVKAFSGYLRERNINIVDLSTVIARGEYTMVWMLSIPAGTEISKLKKSLELSLGHLNMKIGLRHQAIFTQTNEI
jgi:glycine cleavage system transcriptional repressor